MPTNPQQLLSEHLPAVLEWANLIRQHALQNGEPLTDREFEFATKIGIARPDLVRVLVVHEMPPVPQEVADLSFDFLDVSTAAGLTLGYAILVSKGHENFRLIRHELGHVLQVERVGSMEAFLKIYFEQVLHYGYDNAPYEVEANNYESYES